MTMVLRDICRWRDCQIWHTMPTSGQAVNGPLRTIFAFTHGATVIDQLRTTHLTLLLICLILVAATLAQQNGPTRLAYEDAVKIAELRSKPDGVVAELLHEVQTLLYVDTPRALEPKVLSNPSVDVTLNGKKVRTITRNQRFLAGRTETGSMQLRAVDDVKDLVYWQRLSDFIATWDSGIPVMYNPLQEEAFSGPQTAGSNCGQLTLVPSSEKFTEDQYAFDTYYERGTGQLELRLLFDRPGRNPAVDEPGECRLTMALGKAEIIDVDIREVLRNVAGAHWPLTEFRQAFTSLDKSTNYLKSLSPNDLVARLGEEANKEGEKVEMFGAKIPFDLVSVFGSLLLVSCQFYLWCHLVEYSNRIKNGIQPKDQDPSGYIGFYGDQWPVRVFVLISVLVLPVSVQGFTLWRTAFLQYRWIAPACGLVGSLFFGALLCLRFLRMWQDAQKKAPSATPAAALSA
jgi:hypothetical protein